MKTMTTFFLSIATFVMVSFMPVKLSASEGSGDDRYTEKKQIKKAYDVSSNAKLKISNDYGNLNITTWDQNRVEIEVTISVSGDDEEDVKEKLKEIDVIFKASSSLVFAKTKFGSGSSWSSDDMKINVDYVVKMPVTNNVDLNNDYGSIYLTDIEGSANISCDYGSVRTGKLLSDDNDLSFDYSKNCYFEYIKKGEISADYSGFEVSEAGSLEISADYTDIEIGKVSKVEYSSDYSKMDIDQVQYIEGNGDYFTMNIGDLTQAMRVDGSYGSISVDEVAATANKVEVNGDYLGIKIGYNSEFEFDFEFELEFADISGDVDFNYSQRDTNDFDKYYKGYYGKAGSGKTLRVSSEYGNVRLIKK